MNQDPITYDNICRYVGRLYLQFAQDLERLQALADVRIHQLETELNTARKDKARPCISTNENG